MNIEAFQHGYTQKTAGPIGEQLWGLPGSILGALVPGGNPVAAGYGAGSGATEEEMADINAKPVKAAIPFVAPSRTGRRLRVSHDRAKKVLGDKGNKAKRNIVGELLGQLTSGIAPAAIGAGLGALGAPEDRGAGAAVGGVLGGYAGVAIPNLAAVALALYKKRRTPGEQIKHDSKAHDAANYLLPGHSTYNYFKRLGSTGEPLEKGDLSGKDL